MATTADKMEIRAAAICQLIDKSVGRSFTLGLANIDWRMDHTIYHSALHLFSLYMPLWIRRRLFTDGLLKYVFCMKGM